MEILNAYDLTGSLRDAGELAGCSHHTVKHYVDRRAAGGELDQAAARPQLIDEYLPKVEEWVERSKGKVRADVAHDKLLALGYTGSERTTRRAVAKVKQSYRAGHVRVHRPWVTEPGMWLQYDYGDGPVVDGVKTVLFVAWLAWSRFRADVRVAMVDRRHSVGGHWLEAYPFVRLHQASAFYGVASTLLGGGQVQRRGPEEGLHERATQADICAYYARVLDRLLESGKVEFFPNSEYVGDGTIVSRVSGERFEVPGSRIVDARYLAPSIPAEKPPPFSVSPDARVVPVNDLARLEEAPSQYVIVGSGKTATDACIWLLSRGVDPDAICWVRPRDPWMLNRAVVQPDPAVFLGMAADTMQAAEESTSLEDLFLRLEDAGIMLRIDRTVTPTMAKTPTLATWELEQLRTLENVVRRGHIRNVGRGKLTFEDGLSTSPTTPWSCTAPRTA